MMPRQQVLQRIAEAETYGIEKVLQQRQSVARLTAENAKLWGWVNEKEKKEGS